MRSTLPRFRLELFESPLSTNLSMINTADAVMTMAAKPKINSPRWRDNMTIKPEIDLGTLELDFSVLEGLDLLLLGAGDVFGVWELGRSSGGEFA